MSAQAQQQTLPTSPHSSTTTTTTTTSEPTEHLYQAISSYPFDSDPSYQSGLASILGHPGTPATQQEITEKPQLVLRAKCFYYTRKFNTLPVEVQKYAAWLKNQQQAPPVETNLRAEQQRQESESTTDISDTKLNATTTANQTAPTVPSNTISTQTATDQPPPPPYPTSFAEIIDLITNNKPIPGIQEIPTTVLEPGSSKRDKAARRRKPWEKNDSEGNVDDGENSNEVKSVGVSGSTTTAAAAAGAVSAGTDGVNTEQAPTVAALGRPSKGGGVAHILQPEAIPERTLVADD